MPGSKHRPSAGRTSGIGELFRQAVKAVFGRDEDEPEPPKRRGGGEAGRAFPAAARAAFRAVARPPPERHRPATPGANTADKPPALSHGQPAARGRYAALQPARATAAGTTASDVVKAAGEAAREVLSYVARIPAEIYEAAGDYLCDALDWMNPYGDFDGDDGDDLDGNFDPAQDHYFPQP